jgi:hypothetical protein
MDLWSLALHEYSQWILRGPQQGKVLTLAKVKALKRAWATQGYTVDPVAVQVHKGQLEVAIEPVSLQILEQQM